MNKPWYFVKEAAGVIGFVGGDHPAALRQSEIDEIKARIEAATGKEGMGYGDFKLLAALGAWLGWQAILPVVLMASVLVWRPTGLFGQRT